ncbi:glucose-6-phosphate 1-dehydrogenase family protein [Wielerella bovis]|uniref:glucose-6-phosphate 1-dehydrogenase family protein n=1 Tax=Wielerella bovis TaxID=2917790 RepID=UPI00201A0FB1|nr:glucose-6-phosphate 1-dehydrogenase family protein [Wielerella bovis]MCG7657695.1 glucose-6-phosphate 1-dehydrogenase family protein [Wielerella bovis]MCG7659916.1 glucose-6-phosphate 1-dehydrogenase family protein [Wielerella bovis]
MLTAQHCDLFNRPFFQFAQLKKYAPETIPQLKADYRAAWQDWQSVIQHVAADLAQDNPQFAPPHIERWCNGWQVRAHFFAYFKYAQYQQDAAILSVLLNRRRLTVSLDWHCYKADRSTIALPQYNQWLDNLNREDFGDFDVWHGDESEYADYVALNRQPENALILRDDADFFCIGTHLECDTIGCVDSVAWIAAQIRALTPLYERCFI